MIDGLRESGRKCWMESRRRKSTSQQKKGNVQIIIEEHI